MDDLASFKKIVADAMFVPGISARDALLVEADQMIAQLGGRVTTQ